MTKCSVCSNNATRKIQVFWKREKWIPRCDEHIVKGYTGKIRNIKEKKI